MGREREGGSQDEREDIEKKILDGSSFSPITTHLNFTYINIELIVHPPKPVCFVLPCILWCFLPSQKTNFCFLPSIPPPSPRSKLLFDSFVNEQISDWPNDQWLVLLVSMNVPIARWSKYNIWWIRHYCDYFHLALIFIKIKAMPNNYRKYFKVNL